MSMAEGSEAEAITDLGGTRDEYRTRLMINGCLVDITHAVGEVDVVHVHNPDNKRMTILTGSEFEAIGLGYMHYHKLDMSHAIRRGKE